MPVGLKRKGSQWCVVEPGGRELHCYSGSDAHDRALAYQRAINANLTHKSMAIDLGTIKLDDSNEGQWIQLMPFGSWKHPVHGTIEITPERAQRFADNFKANVRGQDLDIDYDHKESVQGGKAAGWFRDVEVRDDGLWGLVEFTEPARKAVSNKEYRYFSPEYADEWTPPQQGTPVKDVLFGGALTNRPHLKGILPINLTEVLDAQGGNRMDPKKLRQLLGLPEDATDDLVDETLSALPEAVQELIKTEAAGEQKPKPEPEKDEKPEPEKEEESEEDKELVALAEKNPAVKRLMEEQASMRKEQAQTRKDMIELQKTNRLREVETSILKLNEGRKNLLPPAIAKKLTETVVDLPRTQGDEIIKLFEETLEEGLVELGEAEINAPRTGGTGKDPIQLFEDAMTKMCKEDDKLTVWDAMDRVSAEQPELYEQYRQAQLSNAREGVS